MSQNQVLIDCLLEQIKLKDDQIAALQQSLDLANKALSDLSVGGRPRKAAKHVAPADIVEYKRDHMALSNIEIANYFEVDTATVSRVLKKEKLPTKAQYVRQYVVDHPTTSIDDLAHDLGVTKPYLTNFINRNNLRGL